jgi:hypothetical protein
MPFIVEDGSGILGANSLASVEFATAYHTERANSAWLALDLATQQANLIKGTDYITAVFGPKFNGYPVTSIQTTPFPRIISGVNVGNPLSVQQATAELALSSSAGSLYPVVGSRTKKMVKVGPITVEYDGSAQSTNMFYSATLKLVPYLQTGAMNGSQARLIRV